MITLDDIRIKLQNSIYNSGISKKDLSTKLNIKQPTLSQYLSGRAMPALDTLANLCNVLDVEPNEILCFSGRAYNAEYEKTSEPMAERLTKEESALLQAFKGLTKEKKAALFAMLDIKPL